MVGDALLSEEGRGVTVVIGMFLSTVKVTMGLAVLQEAVSKVLETLWSRIFFILLFIFYPFPPSSFWCGKKVSSRKERSGGSTPISHRDLNNTTQLVNRNWCTTPQGRFFGACVHITTVAHPLTRIIVRDRGRVILPPSWSSDKGYLMQCGPSPRGCDKDRKGYAWLKVKDDKRCAEHGDRWRSNQCWTTFDGSGTRYCW